MTPEGRIKNKINKLLDEYGKHIYRYMPVPSGYGRRTIDYLGCIKGVFFGIEAKKPGGKATALQEAAMQQMHDAGGMVFMIENDADVAELKHWLDSAMKIVEWRVYP